jgi:hypothetical protein
LVVDAVRGGTVDLHVFSTFALEGVDGLGGCTVLSVSFDAVRSRTAFR